MSVTNFRQYYDENPVGNIWTLYDTWAEMHYFPPNGEVHEIRINNDADPDTQPHSHIFVSFGIRVRPVTGLIYPCGVHYRIKAGEEKIWRIPKGAPLSGTAYLWLRCNDAADIIPVPKRLLIIGTGGIAV